MEKDLEKQTKTMKDVIPKSAFANNEAKEELNKVNETEKNVDKEKLFYKKNKRTYNFKNFQTIRIFGEDIYEGEITFEEADEDQSNLANKIKDFISRTKPKNDKKKQEKEKLA